MTVMLFIRSSLSSALILAAMIMHSITIAQTFNPSPSQIEQFKRMSPSQQEVVAKSLGVDIENIRNFEKNPSSQTKAQEKISGNREKMIEKKYLTSTGENEDNLIITEEDVPTKKMPEKEGLNIFGYDIFDNGADSFTPSSNIPIPANYVLGPGDTLNIQLFGKDNISHLLELDRNGKIQFPDLGPIALAGMTFTQAKNHLNKTITEQIIGIDVNISMGELRTIRIFVLGDVNVPGSYVVGSLSTMTNAIFSSGGIKDKGSMRNIQLKRSGKTITTLDLYELLLAGNTRNDRRLLPGDVIFVPPVGKMVGIKGAVKRPAFYEVKKEKTVLEVLALAGGLMASAYMPASKIERLTPKGTKTLVNIDLSNDRGLQRHINDEDIIHIESSIDTIQNVIELAGHVNRPGEYSWRSGLYFSDIVKGIDDMLESPDIQAGLIVHKNKMDARLSVSLFSPQDAFENPKTQQDPQLQAGDTIWLFDYIKDRSSILADVIERLKIQADFTEREKTVLINGSVRFPGEYPLSTNMSTKDLIDLAGGLTEGSMGSRAEITRYTVISGQKETKIEHIKIDLRQENPLIKASDSLRVQQIPNWMRKETVEIQGEVMHPGIYSILPGETLLDVLKRAGGLTKLAYADGAVFSRKELRALEKERLESLKNTIQSDISSSNIESSNSSGKKEIGQEEIDRILKNIDTIDPIGRMVINLNGVIKKSKKYNFPLSNGDTLVVPKFKPSVTVVGEAQFPTSHFYDKQLSFDDYVQLSGGTKRNADKKRIYVVKSNGSVIVPSKSKWFKAKKQQMSPGDTIVIPIDTKKVDRLTLWKEVTQIMSNSAVTAATISRL